MNIWTFFDRFYQMVTDCLFCCASYHKFLDKRMSSDDANMNICGIEFEPCSQCLKFFRGTLPNEKAANISDLKPSSHFPSTIKCFQNQIEIEFGFTFDNGVKSSIWTPTCGCTRAKSTTASPRKEKPEDSNNSENYSPNNIPSGK